MSQLKLVYAGAEYLDRMRALQFNLLQPDGIQLDYLVINHVGELFRRMAQDAEFDVAEMSMSTLMVMTAQGDNRLVGIPVFPSRAFRHSQVYIHTSSGIERPEDLRGRNVGVPEYQMTAALWQRAFMEHDFGVRPDEMIWWTGGLKTPEYTERRHHDIPDSVHLERIPKDKTLEGMLVTGELDALFHAHAPDPYREGSTSVRRLFEDYRSVETDYYLKHRLFPVMHTVVVNRRVYDEHPWVVVALLDAFEESKRLGYERMRDLDTLGISLPWLAAELDETQTLFGGDPFAYGYGANYDLLEAMTVYSHEQGLSDRKLDPEELFAPESLSWEPRPDSGAWVRA